MNVRICKFRKKDQDETYKFCMSIFREFSVDTSEHVLLDDFAKFFGKPREAFFLAKSGGRLVGCGGIKELGKLTAKLKMLYIHKDFRRSGIGSKILRELLRFAKENGYRMVVLDVGVNNKAAQGFYSAHGFEFFKPEPRKDWEETKKSDEYVFQRMRLA
jgi:ribosomal protein S18 acetylase RimI-like enzyme